MYREFIPAENEEVAKQYVEGNGDIISITDVTEDYPISISFLKATLENAHYGRAEIDLITRLLQEYEAHI